jgi:hypothetical protein
MGNTRDSMMKSSSHLTQHHAKEAEMKEKSAQIQADQKTAYFEKIKSLQKKQRNDPAEQ